MILFNNTLTVVQCDVFDVSPLINHRLRGNDSTVVTMTSKVNGKMEILTPVNLKPLKILIPNLD